MKKITSLEIPDVKVLWPNIHSDNRGHFLETYNRETYTSAGIENRFIQDNQSFSAQKGTIRGMHFQIPPFAQAKLVRVLRGAIFDIAVDMRAESPSYKHWCGARITAEEQNQIFVPAGFAHGFITTEPNTVVQYKVDNKYSRDHERGFIWNDPDINIGWVPGCANQTEPDNIAPEIIVSEKDGNLPNAKSLSAYF